MNAWCAVDKAAVQWFLSLPDPPRPSSVNGIREWTPEDPASSTVRLLKPSVFVEHSERARGDSLRVTQTNDSDEA